VHKSHPVSPANHVENADSAERARIPLLHISLHGGLHRVRELANDRDGPTIARQVPLLEAVNRLLEDEQRDDNYEGRVQPRRAVQSAGEERRAGESMLVGGSGRGHRDGRRAAYIHGRHGRRGRRRGRGSVKREGTARRVDRGLLLSRILQPFRFIPYACADWLTRNRPIQEIEAS